MQSDQFDRSFSRFSASNAAILLLLGLAACGAPSADDDVDAEAAFRSTTFYVNSLVDAPRSPGAAACECESTLVTGKFCTLRAAVQTANLCSGSDTIVLTVSGTYPLTIGSGTDDDDGKGDLDIFEELTIHSQAQPTPVSATIDAAAIDDRVFDIHPAAKDVSLRGMKVMNGNLDPDKHGADANGGCIRVVLSDLSLDTMIVGGESPEGVAQGCRGHDGGGLYAEKSQVLITASAFAHNLADVDTGGAAGVGGGIAAYGTTLIVDDTSLLWNVATGRGGGLEIHDSPLANLSALVVDGNHAEVSGGGLELLSEFTLSDSSLRNNEVLGATGDGGGGVYVGPVASGDSSIEATRIQSNLAHRGAGMTVEGALRVFEVDILRNDASAPDGQGGGVRTLLGSSLTLEQSSVHSNRAEDGGGLYIEGQLEAVNSTIARNHAIGEGGGLRVIDGGDAKLLHCTVNGNHALGGTGGGMQVLAGGLASLDRSILWDNTQLTGPAECIGSVTSPTVVVTDPGSCVSPAASIIAATASGWSPLAYGGHPTATIPISVPNSALGAAEPCGVDVDQRGVPRTAAACDVGAYENPTS